MRPLETPAIFYPQSIPVKIASLGVWPSDQPVGGRGESPVGGPADEALAARVLVQAVQFLPPETLGLQQLPGCRVACQKRALAIVTRGRAQHVAETRGEMSRTVVAQLTPGELAEFSERAGQGAWRVEIRVEDDRMRMRGHDDERVDAELLLIVTISVRLSVTMRHAASVTKIGNQSTIVECHEVDGAIVGGIR